MTILGSLVLTLLTISVVLVYVWIYLTMVKAKQDTTVILTLGVPMTILMLYNLTVMWISTFELIVLRELIWM